MAYQAIDGETGMPLDVIPATTDADPGYHTGLSMLSVLDDVAVRLERSVGGGVGSRL
jgi:hypothetical protein